MLKRAPKLNGLDIFGTQGPRGLAAIFASMAERRTWWSGGRSCYNANGAPKAAFATKRAAEKAIPKTARGLHAYRCADHGWHLGHG